MASFMQRLRSGFTQSPEKITETSSSTSKENKSSPLEQVAPRSSVDHLLCSYQERGLSNVFVPGGSQKAAKALTLASSVALLTGSNADTSLPKAAELTGIAEMAHALKETGKIVTIVTDSMSKPAIHAALNEINPNSARYIRFATCDEKDREAAQAHAKKILEDYKIDTVFASGLPRPAKGSVALHEVLTQANQKELQTIAVGSEANATLTLQANDHSQPQGEITKAPVQPGVADGVTRRGDIETPAKDSIVSQILKDIASQIETAKPASGIVASKTQKGPFVIAAFDSSNGGLIAARNLAGYLKARSHHDAKFVIVADHGNAPYGEKTRPQLVTLVGNGLKTAELLGVDAITMACNTACTSFPESKDGIKVLVIDLIDVTSKAIVEVGGDKPVIFSTPATAKDPMYPDLVREASGDKKTELKCIGAQKWAPLINDLQHLSDKPSDIAYVNQAVQEYVKEVPKDATSVFLCCTHYPALKSKIEEAMRAAGLGHIPVIDPMEYQAEELSRQLDHMEPSHTGPDDGDRSLLVVTSSRKAGVQQSAQALLATNDVKVLQADFGPGFQMALLRDPRAEAKSERTAKYMAKWLGNRMTSGKHFTNHTQSPLEQRAARKTGAAPDLNS